MLMPKKKEEWENKFFYWVININYDLKGLINKLILVSLGTKKSKFFYKTSENFQSILQG